MRVAIVQCRGTPYEIGRQQAERFLTTPKGRAFRRAVRAPAHFDMAAQERFFARFSPAMWEEIRGLADELQVSLERACLFFGNEGLPFRSGGCSAVMTPSAYGRNYDFRRTQYGARLALIQPTGSHASIGFSERLTGRLDGMNEHGLSIGLHLVGGKLARGATNILIVRLVLDQCATTEEAIGLLGKLSPARRYNFSLLDAAGQAAVFEASPSGFAVRRGTALACTNHFQSPAMRMWNGRLGPSTRNRLPPLETWANQALPAGELFTKMNRIDSPVFMRGRGTFGTLHTLVTDPAKRHVRIGVGGNAMDQPSAELQLDFGAWCAGADLARTELETGA